MERFLKRIILGPFFWPLVFIFSLQRTIDADLGWNIRIGEWIIKHGQIPHTDLFSFWAHNYPYVYHSWLSQVLIYLVDNHFGLWGLTISFTGILVLSFYIWQHLIDELGISRLWSRILMLIMAPTFFVSILVRPQMFSLLFVCLLIYCLFHYRQNYKPLFFILPTIFLAWVNLHGGYSIGFVIMIAFFTAEVWQGGQRGKMRQVFLSILLIIISFLATLVSPFGLQSYRQLLAMLVNPFYSRYIIEWLPLLARGTQPLVFALLVLGVLLLPFVFHLVKINWTIWGLTSALFIFTLRVNRLSLFLFIPLVVLLSQILSSLENKLLPIVKHFGRFEKLYLKMAVLLLVISVLLKTGLNIDKISQENQNDQAWGRGLQTIGLIFPVQAAKYLQGKPPLPRLFNNIGWGGYLIWKLPKQTVFGVGGMDSYKVDGRFLLEDYLRLCATAKNYKQLMVNYQIESAILPNDYPLAKTLDKDPRWEKIYQDNICVIFIKKGIKWEVKNGY